jgi:hypothetical protein
MTKRLDYNQIAPNGAKALGGVYGYIMQSELLAELVELVYLRVPQHRFKTQEFCDKSLAQDQGAGHQVFRSSRYKVAV